MLGGLDLGFVACHPAETSFLSPCHHHLPPVHPSPSHCTIPRLWPAAQIYREEVGRGFCCLGMLGHPALGWASPPVPSPSSDGTALPAVPQGSWPGLAVHRPQSSPATPRESSGDPSLHARDVLSVQRPRLPAPREGKGGRRRRRREEGDEEPTREFIAC